MSHARGSLYPPVAHYAAILLIQTFGIQESSEIQHCNEISLFLNAEQPIWAAS